MDKYAQLAASAQFACTILGNPSTWDVLTLPIPFRPADLPEQMARRGLRFLGVGAVVNGLPITALTEAQCPELTKILFLAFYAEVERWLAGKVPTPEEAADDSEAWCFRLFALPDPRG